MLENLKILVILLFCIGAFLEVVEIHFSSPMPKLRKKDLSGYISGTIFALIALLIYLFGNYSACLHDAQRWA